MVQLYRRPDEYDLEHLGDDEDIQFYVSLARNLMPKSVLELACGTGRITIPLAEEGARSGYSVVGLDAEPAMLKQAAQKVKRLPASVRSRISLVKVHMLTWRRWQRFELRIMFQYAKYRGKNGIERYIDDFESHVYFPRELQLIFMLAGFDIEHVYGDYARRQLRSESRQMIVIGKETDWSLIGRPARPRHGRFSAFC